jgi:hypothetical protein
MRIYGSIILAGVLSVGLVSERGQSEEIIEVNGCAPGWILMGSGTNWWCMADPSHTTPPPSGGGDDGEDSGEGRGGGRGGGGGGGDTEPVPQDSWDRETIAEAKRRWRCGQCKVSFGKCEEQWKAAENRCVMSAKAQAQWRCDIIGRKGSTVTSWGCSITQHRDEFCTGVEAPWDSKFRWLYFCDDTKCEGPGVHFCQESWAASRPGGSTQVVDTGMFTVNFQSVAGSFGKTTTSTYNLSPSLGYLQACATMGNVLFASCGTQRDACYESYSCVDGQDM